MLTFVGLLRAVAQFCTRWPSQASSTDHRLEITPRPEKTSCEGGSNSCTEPGHEEAVCTTRHAGGTCTAVTPQTDTFNADAVIDVSTCSDANALCAHDDDDGLARLQAATKPLDIHDSLETESPLSTLESGLTSPQSDLATPAADDVQSTVAGFRKFLLKLSHTDHGTKRRRRQVQLRDKKRSKESRQALPVHQIQLKPTTGEWFDMSLHAPRLPAGDMCVQGPQKDHPGKQGAVQENSVRQRGGPRMLCSMSAGNSKHHKEESALPKEVTAAAKMPAMAKQRRLQVQEHSSVASGCQATGSTVRRGQLSADSSTSTARSHLINLTASGSHAQEGLAVQPEQGSSVRGRKWYAEGNGRAQRQQLATTPRGQRAQAMLTRGPSTHLTHDPNGTRPLPLPQTKCRTSSALQRVAAQAGIAKIHTRQTSAEPILQRGADRALKAAGCSKSCDPGSRFSWHTDNTVLFRPLAHESNTCFTTWSISLASPLEGNCKSNVPAEATINLIDGMPDARRAALSESGEPAAMRKQLP
mmetsp:Transcript_126589/g.253111  ORF Transcript_126589/g.253111 Transcript_126589/m.253111 type:complete len:528 (-) Transcript_126589:326-1909(-)|eukprot:CAMPEP_0172799214 /NCGR_PEP_ID=MMETSP1075-20121228/1733_1 /TAXON_ID=2916 /ORGANISM="Ceratium fusus, Strain PA161109" /LENGTH=527 /DNA_ID=CAMNT_0013636863 /DNA_START=51 /DNA_END=1634 /DNA_ORIENTATION=-